MAMINKKWVIATGGFMVLLGFFLPSFEISAMGWIEGQVSLASLAQGSLLWNPQLALYLIVISVFAIIALTFLKPVDAKQKHLFFWGRVIGAGLGALVFVIYTMLLYSSVQEAGYGLISLGLKVGVLFLLGGYGLIGVGLLMEIGSLAQISIPDVFASRSALPVRRSPKPSPEPRRPYACLEIVKGNLGKSVVRVDSSNFSIGRGNWNDLVLSNRAVSKDHAKLRYAQGKWFIQDAGSRNGIQVNGRFVRASSLNTGDRITIEKYEFVFKA